MRLFSSRQQLEIMSREEACTMYCGDSVTLCRILNCLKLYIPSDDVSMGPHLGLDGFWESWITMYVQTQLKRFMGAVAGTSAATVVNVGAAFGYYSIFCAAHGARVFAFEPQPKLADLIRRSTTVNGVAERCTVIDRVVSDEPGKTVSLFTARHFAGGATARNQENVVDPNVIWEPPTPVRTTTLDEHLGDQHVDLFIIDTEGFEPQVLAGAKRTLARNPQAVIVIEITPSWYERAGVFVSQLEKSYVINEINGDGSAVPTTAEKVLQLTQSTVALVPRSA